MRRRRWVVNSDKILTNEPRNHKRQLKITRVKVPQFPIHQNPWIAKHPDAIAAFISALPVHTWFCCALPSTPPIPFWIMLPANRCWRKPEVFQMVNTARYSDNPCFTRTRLAQNHLAVAHDDLAVLFPYAFHPNTPSSPFSTIGPNCSCTTEYAPLR